MKITLIILMMAVFVLNGCTESSTPNALDEGDLTLNTSKTVYSCAVDSDCILTALTNTPISTAECQCHFFCFGELVNLIENTKRETAYEKFCGGTVDDLPALNCPDADCSIACAGMKYQTLCENNLCVEKTSCPKTY